MTPSEFQDQQRNVTARQHEVERKSLQAKHTPGPWGTDESEHDEPYQDIEVVADTRGICRIWIDDAPVRDYNAEQRANAALIAAAPELLESLQKILKVTIVRVDDLTVEQVEAWTKARAAIAKAGGAA